MKTANVTQKQVNAAIDHLLAAAAKFEAARDACEFESPAYWANHDAFINLVVTAENLMP
jgi:hypothetical protein